MKSGDVCPSCGAGIMRIGNTITTTGNNRRQYLKCNSCGADAKNGQTRRDDLPVVVVPRPRCPNCQSYDLKTQRSVKDSDGSSTRDTRCRRCRTRFILIVETDEPNFGGIGGELS